MFSLFDLDSCLSALGWLVLPTIETEMKHISACQVRRTRLECHAQMPQQHFFTVFPAQNSVYLKHHIKRFQLEA